MTIEHLSDAEILAVKEQAGSIRQAAKQLGCVRSTLSRRLLKIGAEGNAKPAYIPPTLEESELPVEDIIARNKRSFERRRKAEASRQWMEFKVRARGPFMLVFMGDPHGDDNGCNWTMLERDIAIIRDTEATFGVNLGDYLNNWALRLQRLYAEQQTTRSEAWKLAEWLFGQKKPNGQSMWWLLLKGNHDLWSSSFGNGDPLDWMARGEAVLQDWQAQIVAVSGKCRIPIWAAHDFKGSSIWNPLHGPLRKGMLNAGASVYACGDKHNWACLEVESQEDPGRIFWAVRARGYKFIDSHASRLGFGSQDHGASIAMIVDPDAEGPNRVRCIPCLEEARDYLAFKRRNA